MMPIPQNILNAFSLSILIQARRPIYDSVGASLRVCTAQRARHHADVGIPGTTHLGLGWTEPVAAQRPRVSRTTQLHCKNYQSYVTAQPCEREHRRSPALVVRSHYEEISPLQGTPLLRFHLQWCGKGAGIWLKKLFTAIFSRGFIN